MINNGIAQRQNVIENIELLAAQRQLYYEAKQASVLQFIISIVIPLIIPWVKNVSVNHDKQLAFVVLISIVLLLFNALYLEKVIKTKKVSASKIQELFDTRVLQIKWNEKLCGAKEVAYKGKHKCAEKYIKRNGTSNNLFNWYPNIYSSVDISVGRIMCQKANVAWDNDIRRKFQNVLMIMLLMSSIIIISYSIIENKTFTETIISILAPIFPIGFYSFKRYCENRDTLLVVEKINTHLDNVWESIIESKASIGDLEKSSRRLQDMIFNHRSNALKIWDWFYLISRKTQEFDMDISANIIIEEYNNRKID